MLAWLVEGRSHQPIIIDDLRITAVVAAKISQIFREQRYPLGLPYTIHDAVFDIAWTFLCFTFVLKAQGQTSNVSSQG